MEKYRDEAQYNVKLRNVMGLRMTQGGRMPPKYSHKGAECPSPP